MWRIQWRRRGSSSTGAANGATWMGMEPHINARYVERVQALRQRPQLLTFLEISQAHCTCVAFMIINIVTVICFNLLLVILVYWNQVCRWGGRDALVEVRHLSRHIRLLFRWVLVCDALVEHAYGYDMVGWDNKSCWTHGNKKDNNVVWQRMMTIVIRHGLKIMWRCQKEMVAMFLIKSYKK